MKVLIRADASAVIGSGHVMRCLALAAALRTLGAEVSFACRPLPGALSEGIAAQGWRLYELANAEGAGAKALSVGEPGVQASLCWQADIRALGERLPANAAFDWIVVDHYQLDQHWQRAARRWAGQIMVIDDLANRAHAADLLLDQNCNATPQRYTPWLAGPCRSLLGPHYALLRDEFRVEPRPVATVVERVLVNFGGMDAAGQTLKAMRALMPFDGLQVTCVAGLNSPHWAELQSLLAERPHWLLLTHSDDFAQLMSEADLFVGAGGGTTWERAALGLPTICMAVAANQQANAEALAAAGAHCYLGPCEQVSVAMLTAAIGHLLDALDVRQQYAQRSLQRVDGRGAQRVAVAMAGPTVRLREATLAQAQLLFEGRNAWEVRRWSGQSAALDWDGHVQWLTALLADPERKLLLASTADGPLGVLRYDRAGECAEVSIYLLAGRFGLGWGRILLARGEQFIAGHWPLVGKLEARVLPDNKASVSLFSDCGYVRHGERFTRALQSPTHNVPAPGVFSVPAIGPINKDQS